MSPTLLPAEAMLTCSPAELFTLASLLGGEMLVGVDDPFPGWLSEEIEEAAQAARQSLAERGHLTLQPDGRVVMDLLPAALVGAMVQPRTVLLLSAALPDSTARRWAFYRRPPLTVLLEEVQGGYLLRPLEGRQRVEERILEAWQIQAQKAARAASFLLPQQAIEQARQARLQGEEAVRQTLQRLGIAARNARALAATLCAARCNGALVLLTRRGAAWQTDGLGMLDGENGLWQLRSRPGDNLVELLPCPAGRLRADLQALLNRFWPPDEG